MYAALTTLHSITITITITHELYRREKVVLN